MRLSEIATRVFIAPIPMPVLQRDAVTAVGDVITSLAIRIQHDDGGARNTENMSAAFMYCRATAT